MSFAYMSVDNPRFPYRLKDLDVFFTDMSCLDVIEAVLDEEGEIKNFPGIIKDERWESKHRIGQCYDVRFEAQFFAMESGQFLMVWMVQPSGWHWVDEDGFGFNGDSVIMLYSLLDGDGRFAKPFELFSIDGTRYCHEYDKYVK